MGINATFWHRANVYFHMHHTPIVAAYGTNYEQNQPILFWYDKHIKIMKHIAIIIQISKVAIVTQIKFGTKPTTIL